MLSAFIDSSYQLVTASSYMWKEKEKLLRKNHKNTALFTFSCSLGIEIYKESRLFSIE
jgi:hypothetical protein